VERVKKEKTHTRTMSTQTVMQVYREDPTQWHTWSPLPPAAPEAPPLLEDVVDVQSTQPLYWELLQAGADPRTTPAEKRVINDTKSRFSALRVLMDRARYELWEPLSDLKQKYRALYGPDAVYPTPRLLMLRLMSYADIKSEIASLLAYADPSKQGELSSEAAFFNPKAPQSTLDDLGPDCLGYDKWMRGHGVSGVQDVTFGGGNRTASNSSYQGLASRGLDPKHRYGLVADWGSLGVSYRNGPVRVIHACCGESDGRTTGCWIMLDKTQELGVPLSYEVMNETDPWQELSVDALSAGALQRRLVADIRIGTAFRDLNLYTTLHATIQGAWGTLAPRLTQHILSYRDVADDAIGDEEPIPRDPYTLFVSGTADEPIFKRMIQALVRFNEVHCTWQEFPSTEGQWAALINARFFKAGSVVVYFNDETRGFIAFEGFTGGDPGRRDRITLLRIGDSDPARIVDLVAKLERLKDYPGGAGVLRFETDLDADIETLNDLLRNTRERDALRLDASEDTRSWGTIVPTWNALSLPVRNLATEEETEQVEEFIADSAAFSQRSEDVDTTLYQARRDANKLLKKFHKNVRDNTTDTAAEMVVAENVFDASVANSAASLANLKRTRLAQAVEDGDDIGFVADTQAVVDKLVFYERSTSTSGKTMPGLPPVLQELPALPELVTSDTLNQYLLDLAARGADYGDARDMLESLVEVTRVPQGALDDAQAALGEVRAFADLGVVLDAQASNAVGQLEAEALHVQNVIDQRLLSAGRLATTIDKLTRGAYAMTTNGFDREADAYRGALALLVQENADVLDLDAVRSQQLLAFTGVVRQQLVRLEQEAQDRFVDFVLRVGPPCSAMRDLVLNSIDSTPLSKIPLEDTGIFAAEGIRRCVDEIRALSNIPFPAPLTAGGTVTNERFRAILDAYDFESGKIFPFPDDGRRDYAPYTRAWIAGVFGNMIPLVVSLAELTPIATDALMLNLENETLAGALTQELNALRADATRAKAAYQRDQQRRRGQQALVPPGGALAPLPESLEGFFSYAVDPRPWLDVELQTPVFVALMENAIMSGVLRTEDPGWMNKYYLPELANYYDSQRGKGDADNFALQMNILTPQDSIQSTWTMGIKSDDSVYLSSALWEDPTRRQALIFAHVRFYRYLRLLEAGESGDRLQQAADDMTAALQVAQLPNQSTAPQAVLVRQPAYALAVTPQDLDAVARRPVFRTRPASVITTTNTTWYGDRGGSCPWDSLFTSTFKVPRTWLEGVIHDAESIIPSGSECIQRSGTQNWAPADYLHQDIWKDMMHMQDQRNPTPQQCISLRQWNTCMPAEEVGGDSPVALLSRMFVFYDVEELVYTPVVQRSEPQIRNVPRAQLRTAQMVFVTNREAFARDGTQYGVPLTLNGNAFTLMGVMSAQAGHWVSYVRDPISGVWWHFDANKKINAPINLWGARREQTLDANGVPLVVKKGIDGYETPAAWIYVRTASFGDIYQGPAPAAATGRPPVTEAFGLSAFGQDVLRNGATGLSNYNVVADSIRDDLQGMVFSAETIFGQDFAERVGFDMGTARFEIPAGARGTRLKMLVYIWDQLVEGARNDNDAAIVARAMQNIRIALLTARFPDPGTEPQEEEEEEVTPLVETGDTSVEQNFPVSSSFKSTFDPAVAPEGLFDEPERYHMYLYFKEQEARPESAPDRENNMRIARLVGRF